MSNKTRELILFKRMSKDVFSVNTKSIIYTITNNEAKEIIKLFNISVFDFNQLSEFNIKYNYTFKVETKWSK